VIESIKGSEFDCATGHIKFDKFNNPIKRAVIMEIVENAERFWGEY
jgi:hypothetical protein